MADAPVTADSPRDRINKLLPGDVTAAFLSAKAALVSVAHEQAATYVFWTFIIILVLCPFYFHYVTKAKTKYHIVFLTLSFVVFAISIADTQFADFFNNLFAPRDMQPPIKAIAIVLPILWTYLVAQISVVAMHDNDQPPDPAQGAAAANNAG